MKDAWPKTWSLFSQMINAVRLWYLRLIGELIDLVYNSLMLFCQFAIIERKLQYVMCQLKA
jgi:hypothetical protein